jgi:hypothetical protein
MGEWRSVGEPGRGVWVPIGDPPAPSASARMDCRAFRKRHLAFVDNTLSGIDTAAMREHVRVCASCAKLDSSVRRSLLLVRNLPCIEPSAEFSARLAARMAEERSGGFVATPTYRVPGIRVFFATAACIVALGFVTASALERAAPDVLPVLPAVVATPNLSAMMAASTDETPAFMATVSTGLPVWPAMLLGDEAQIRFATSEFQNIAWTRE